MHTAKKEYKKGKIPQCCSNLYDNNSKAHREHVAS
jgi:hypothetical protein